jgi:hypothetical protein
MENRENMGKLWKSEKRTVKHHETTHEKLITSKITPDKHSCRLFPWILLLQKEYISK